MRQLIMKNGKIYGNTSVLYSEEEIQSMKAGGYRIKIVEDSEAEKFIKNSKDDEDDE